MKKQIKACKKISESLAKTNYNSLRRFSKKWLGLIIAVICGGIVIWTRLKYLSGNFGNYDVAGIVYNADILLEGGLPYVDTFEYKCPLTFFLFAFIFKVFGTDIMHVRMIWGILHLLSCWVLYLAVKRLSGHVSAALAAFLLAVFGVLSDINYTSWLVLPLTLTIYFVVRAKQSSNLFWFFTVGVLTTVSFLVKKNGGFILFATIPLFFSAPLPNQNKQSMVKMFRNITIMGMGGIFGLLPLLVYYFLQGESLALLNGLFPGWILKGVLAAKSSSDSGYLSITNLPKGLLQICDLYPLPAALCIVTMVSMLLKRSFFGFHGKLALAWFLASFFSLVITGGRFYNHHTILYLPSLAFLAVTPGAWSWYWSKIQSISRYSIKIIILVLIACLAIWGIEWPIQNIVTDKRHYYDVPSVMGKMEEQKYLGDYIKSRTSKNDTIIAWGWQAWPIYHWAGRKSPSPVYKEMAVLTEVSTNTSWSPSKPMHFVPSHIADKYLESVLEKKPAFVVISNWYPAVSQSKVEPLKEFTELYRYIKKNYSVTKRSQWFLLLERDDRLKSQTNLSPQTNTP